MQLGVGLGLPYNLGKPAAGFSPLDLSPVLWLDASDTSTITEVGGAVSQWDDKSGNGNHVTQGTAANQPTSGTRTLNGLNVIDFDGGSDCIFRANVLTTSIDNITAVIVVDADTTTSQRVPFMNGSGSNGYGIATAADGTNIGWLQGGIAWRASTTPSATGSQIVVWEVNAGTVAMRVDGTNVSNLEQGTPSTPTTRFSLGSHTTTSNFWNGAIAEIIFIDGTLSAGQIAATESYLASKWGITL